MDLDNQALGLNYYGMYFFSHLALTLTAKVGHGRSVDRIREEEISDTETDYGQKLLLVLS